MSKKGGAFIKATMKKPSITSLFCFKKKIHAIFLLLFAISILTIAFYSKYTMNVKKDKRINAFHNNSIDIESLTSLVNENRSVKTTRLATSNATQSHPIVSTATNPAQSANLYCQLAALLPANSSTRIIVNTTVMEIEAIEQLDEVSKLDIGLGGQWKPKNCTPRHRVAIIVPYRDRLDSLKLFLRHMLPFLARQQLDYGIYLIEPVKSVKFNRGLLMNFGFAEALVDANDKWDCFVFHDVDLLPEDVRNIYSCPESPRHMSSAVSTFGYK